MLKKRLQPEEIIGTRRQADVLFGHGRKVAEVVKASGITELTCQH